MSLIALRSIVFLPWYIVSSCVVFLQFSFKLWFYLEERACLTVRQSTQIAPESPHLPRACDSDLFLSCRPSFTNRSPVVRQIGRSTFLGHLFLATQPCKYIFECFISPPGRRWWQRRWGVWGWKFVSVFVILSFLVQSHSWRDITSFDIYPFLGTICCRKRRWFSL